MSIIALSAHWASLGNDLSGRGKMTHVNEMGKKL